MSATKKYRNFVSEPVGDKKVTDLPGIGPTLGKKLVENGFDKSYKILGLYLSKFKNETDFTNWLKTTCGANAKQASECYKALSEYSKEFM